jgi:tetratricopeptide (TPR) repeat protein
LEIAEHVDEFDRAEPRESYLERVKFLDPTDHEFWERCGILELRDERRDRAWTSWRRSLELSDSLLPEILDRSAAYLSPHDILRWVLPDRPDLLLKAALHLYSPPGEGRWPLLEWALALLDSRLPEVRDLGAAILGPDDTLCRILILCRTLPDRADLLLVAASQLYAQAGGGRRLFLEKALALLEKRPVPLGAEDLYLKASIHRALGQKAEAEAAYRALLDREPLDPDRRYELAELLYEQDRFREAFQELLKIQVLQPENDRARAKMDAVKQKIAEGR